MRKLNAPSDLVQDVFSTCIESYRDTALKNRLRSVVPILIDVAAHFEDCALASQTHTIPAADNVGGVVSRNEMVDVYESKFVGGPGRPYYDKYMSLPAHGRCPFCGIGIVATLDHYLPKSKYPALAVTPKNMIPACRDCNLGEKKLFFPRNAEEEPLHPYFDDVEQDIWLSVKFDITNEELVPTYFVRKPAVWDDLLFRRVENHMALYNLYTSYAVHAAEEITGRSGTWHGLLHNCGKNFLAASFHEEAASRERSFLNSWQSALYRGLEENVDQVACWLQFLRGDSVPGDGI